MILVLLCYKQTFCCRIVFVGSRLSSPGPQQRRFAAYIEGLANAAGHADRHTPLKNYCTGLLLPGERKSVEPMAARLAPDNVGRMHQSLHHLVADAPWDDEAMLAQVRRAVLPTMQAHGPVVAWIIDDTGFPKQGLHSVGVARQYCGQVGKQDNCQVAVSLSIANHHASLPVAYRLYLPDDWAADGERRRKTGVPEDICFKTKPEIALDQLRWECEAGIARGVVLMDPGYGNDAKLRMSTTALGLIYVAGIQSNILVWAPGSEPRPGRKPPKRGRWREPDLISVKELALSLPAKAWHTVKWREGKADWLSSRFARVRVRAGKRY